MTRYYFHWRMPNIWRDWPSPSSGSERFCLWCTCALWCLKIFSAGWTYEAKDGWVSKQLMFRIPILCRQKYHSAVNIYLRIEDENLLCSKLEKTRTNWVNSTNCCWLSSITRSTVSTKAQASKSNNNVNTSTSEALISILSDSSHALIEVLPFSLSSFSQLHANNAVVGSVQSPMCKRNKRFCMINHKKVDSNFNCVIRPRPLS